MFADHLGFACADLFFQFAQHGGPGILTLIDAALRQLPAPGRSLGVRHIGAAGDEHQPFAVEQHGADIGPIRQITHFAASCFAGGSTNALTGASASPFAVNVVVQAATRASVTGRGTETKPSAAPLSKARCGQRIQPLVQRRRIHRIVVDRHIHGPAPDLGQRRLAGSGIDEQQTTMRHLLQHRLELAGHTGQPLPVHLPQGAGYPDIAGEP